MHCQVNRNSSYLYLNFISLVKEKHICLHEQKQQPVIKAHSNTLANVINFISLVKEKHICLHEQKQQPVIKAYSNTLVNVIQCQIGLCHNFVCPSFWS